MRTDSPDFLKFGKFPTGLPGSKRWPHFCAASVSALAAGAKTTIDPNNFLNDNYELPWFLENMIFDVVSSGHLGNIWVQIRPSSSPQWTEDWVPLFMFLHRERVLRLSTASGDGMPYVLPEPYPVKPGEAMQIDFWNRDSSNTADILVGGVGYYESEPAFINPRKIPYIMGDRIASLADGAQEEFDTQRLTPGFDGFVAEWLGVDTDREDNVTGGLYIRHAITGRSKIVETDVSMAAMRDVDTGMIPLHGTRLSDEEGFEVGATNRDGSAAAIVDCAISGYREAA